MKAGYKIMWASVAAVVPILSFSVSNLAPAEAEIIPPDGGVTPLPVAGEMEFSTSWTDGPILLKRRSNEDSSDACEGDYFSPVVLSLPLDNSDMRNTNPNLFDNVMLPQDQLHELRESALARFLNLQVGTTSDASTAEKAWNVWKQIASNHLGDMPVPVADAGDEGEILLFWDSETQYFSAEIAMSGEVYFFYRNHMTGKVWDLDWKYSASTSLPDEVVARINLIG